MPCITINALTRDGYKNIILLFVMLFPIVTGCRKEEKFRYGLEEKTSIKRGYVAAICVEKNIQGLRDIPAYCDVGSDNELISGKYSLRCNYIEKSNCLEFKLIGDFKGDKTQIIAASKKYLRLSKRVVNNVLESDFAEYDFVFYVYDKQANALWEYREGELLLINNGSVQQEQPFSRRKKKPKTKGKG